MTSKDTIRQKICQLLESQLLAVLSTHRTGQPYANLVAIAASKDLTTIFFATARSTRKFTNIQQDNRVALLVDNRTNQSTDFHAATAVTVIGTVAEVEGRMRQQALKTYLAHHPYLEEFVKAPTTALLAIRVSRYIMVSRFQEVFELHLDE